MIKKPEFSRTDVEIIRREELYKRFFRVEKIFLRHKLFNGGWGKEIGRELFVRGEAVAVVLYDPARDLIGMVEQFRVGALEEPNGPWCYEVVAGILEEGESPEDVARRELKEEANIEPYKLEYICNYHIVNEWLGFLTVELMWAKLIKLPRCCEINFGLRKLQ